MRIEAPQTPSLSPARPERGEADPPQLPESVEQRRLVAVVIPDRTSVVHEERHAIRRSVPREDHDPAARRDARADENPVPVDGETTIEKGDEVFFIAARKDIRVVMSEIRKQMHQLEQTDAKYAPFATKVRELAQGFEDEKIVTLVENYLR